jgi:hypothetical protein
LPAAKAGRAAPGLIRHDPPKVSATGERRKLCRLNPKNTQPVRADLLGSDQCSAEDFDARGAAPVLILCRGLIRAGLDPDRAMEVYRGATLALTVRSIGKGACLEVNGAGTGVKTYRQRRRAASQAQKSRPGPCRLAPRPAKRGGAS